MHFILTGEIDSGKSAFVGKLVRRLAHDGYAVSGWTTPAHMEQGSKIGHDFVAISQSESKPPIIFTRPDPFEQSFPWRRFHFNKLAFSQSQEIKPCSDLFVMDEIGPLELEEEMGFAPAARHALETAPHTLTVVRMGLVERFVESACVEEIAVFSLSSRGELEGSLRNALIKPARHP